MSPGPGDRSGARRRAATLSRPSPAQPPPGCRDDNRLSCRQRGADELGAEATWSEVWEQHVGAEFGAKSADEAVATMTARSYVNLIPLMLGGQGRAQVRDFYTN